MSIACGPADIASRAGSAAVPAAGDPDAGGTAAACGSGSRMSAPSPRPSAFLGIGDYLLGQLRVALGPFAVYIIENNRLAKARGFGEPDIPRNDALKDLRPKETAQIGGDLARKSGPLIVHREQNAFDFEAGVQRPPDAHQGVEKLRYPFERQILALNGNYHGIGGNQGV